MLGDGFAGNTNYAALADFVVMVRGVSTMGIAGPALVKASTGETITKEELGGTATQVDKNGIAHLGVDTEQEAFDAARRWLSYLPSNAEAELPIIADDDPPDRRDPELVDMVPANNRRAYDVKKVLRAVFDVDSFYEVQPTYAKNLVIAFARLGGHPVGIVANQPMVLAGTLDADACEKSARFISLCDAFGLPLVFFADIPGFLVGVGGRGLRARPAQRPHHLRARPGHRPRLSVVLRKGYGLGYLGDVRRPQLRRRRRPGLADGRDLRHEHRGRRGRGVPEGLRGRARPGRRPPGDHRPVPGPRRPTGGRRGLRVDDIIDPSDTRSRLIETLATLPRRRFDGIGTRTRGISPI